MPGFEFAVGKILGDVSSLHFRLALFLIGVAQMFLRGDCITHSLFQFSYFWKSALLLTRPDNDTVGKDLEDTASSGS